MNIWPSVLVVQGHTTLFDLKNVNRRTLLWTKLLKNPHHRTRIESATVRTTPTKTIFMRCALSSIIQEKLLVNIIGIKMFVLSLWTSRGRQRYLSIGSKIFFYMEFLEAYIVVMLQNFLASLQYRITENKFWPRHDFQQKRAWEFTSADF